VERKTRRKKADRRIHGLIPCLILVPAGLALGLAAVMDVRIAFAAVFAALIVGVGAGIALHFLYKREGHSDLTGEQSWAKFFDQFRLAFVRPRTFAPWFAVEALFIAVMLEALLLLVLPKIGVYPHGKPGAAPVQNAPENPQPQGGVTPNPPPPPDPNVVADRSITEALARLTKPEERERALGDLSRMKPKADRRTEVAKSIQPLTADTNQSIRIEAIRALAVWGDKEHVPLLIEAMDHEDGLTRRAAAIALKQFPDERAIPVLVKRMSDSACTGESVAALIAIGPVVEKAVLPLLSSKDAFAQAAAVHVVKDVGTADSVPALRKIAATKLYPAGPAEEALKAIAARSKKK